ncbi:MAG: hypothetical protein PHV20_13665 [Bacteroidales bacterium]|nr:hypothetical protein [Bacteroidales bacterium]
MKKQFLKFVGAASLMVIALTVVSCDKTKNDVVTPGKVNEVSGEITTNTTWSKSDTVLLKGFVYVTSGATLTIEAGTIVKGDKATKGTLIIERGAKIMAEGTASNPIVFTSAQPKGQRDYGDWGGLVICGKAKVNATAGQAQVEGGPRSLYGGQDDADNSGIIKYVRIEFCGYPLELNKEINGLTLGGVGSATTIDYVQVSYSGDDSYEWFGGTVNCRHLIAYKGWDDEFDTDFGYTGKLQYLLGIRDPQHADTSASNGFESDNDGTGSTNPPITAATFSNVTLIGPFTGISKGKADADILYATSDAANGAKGGKFQASMHLRRQSALKVHNSIFLGWPYGIRTSDSKGAAGDITMKNVVLAGMWKNYYDGGADSTFYNTAGFNNKVFTSTNDILTTNRDYKSVNAANVAGADFTGMDAWFTRTTKIGAFDGTDWTAGWANFDPQNAIY